MSRPLILFASLAMMAPAGLFAASGGSTEFVGGTIKSIPANAVGSLDASGPEGLRFLYGSSVFSLSYDKITGAQVAEPVSRHLWRVPVPTIGRGVRLLTISYRDADKSGMVTFKAPVPVAWNVWSAIDDRRKKPAASTKAAVSVEEAWWGDKYWRTNRNKEKWAAAPTPDAPGIPAGTKE